MKKCKIDKCDSKSEYSQMCYKHIKRKYVHGDPSITLQSDLKGATCRILDCKLKARKKFMCNSHYTTLWRKENPDKALINKRVSTYKRRLRKLSVLGSHTHNEWLDLLEQFEGLCAYCKIHLATTKDHVVPISKNGTDNIDNILPACKSCNSRKSNMPLEVFIKRMVIYDYDGEYQYDTILIRDGKANYNGKTYEA